MTPYSYGLALRPSSMTESSASARSGARSVLTVTPCTSRITSVALTSAS
jgi:hypothetical protein